MADQTVGLPFFQPGFSPVFLMREFSRALENFFIDLELAAIGRQSLRKFLGEVSFYSEALNAALLQQTATSTSLCCSRDLSAVHYHVGANRTREAVVDAGADSGSRPDAKSKAVNVPSYNCVFTNSV